MPKTIIIDPGHGGFDPGAVYGERKEKEDALRLALAVGAALENQGYHIVYTRQDDHYDSPYEKAQIANNAGGDLFLSFHRNFAERPNLYQGIQALVYDKDPLALKVATAINDNLTAIGFDDLGVEERKELVVLRRTSMPAVLLEIGFVNSDKDNQLFDDNFSAIVSAIASGVTDAYPLMPLQAASREEEIPPADSPVVSPPPATPPEDTPPTPAASPLSDMRHSIQGIRCEIIPPAPPEKPHLWYYVQVGLFRYPENAVYLMEQLKQQGYDSIWRRIGGLIAIWVGPFATLDEAVTMQKKLQADGYETLLVSDDYIVK